MGVNKQRERLNEDILLKNVFHNCKKEREREKGCREKHEEESEEVLVISEDIISHSWDAVTTRSNMTSDPSGL